MISSTDYDKIADAFADRSDIMAGNRFYERPATIGLLPPLKGLDVLDAGCGSGFYTALAHNAGTRFWSGTKAPAPRTAASSMPMSVARSWRSPTTARR